MSRNENILYVNNQIYDLRVLSTFWDNLLWHLTLFDKNSNTLHFVTDNFPVFYTDENFELNFTEPKRPGISWDYSSTAK